MATERLTDRQQLALLKKWGRHNRWGMWIMAQKPPLRGCEVGFDHPDTCQEITGQAATLECAIRRCKAALAKHDEEGRE